MTDWIRPYLLSTLWSKCIASRRVVPKRHDIRQVPISEYHTIVSDKSPSDYVFYTLSIPLDIVRSLTQYCKDICYSCYNTNTLFDIDNEYTKRCKMCGFSSSIPILQKDDVITPSPTRKVPREISTNVYKRLNHFKYWIKRIQGKEKNTLDKYILNDIAKECEKRKISLGDLDYENTRDILKCLGLQKFYNNTYAIIRCLTGSALVDLTYDQEKKLIDMFVKIQEPFYEQHALSERVNMLSYTYILIKLCKIL